MISTHKLAEFHDQLVDDLLIRRFARTTARGRVVAMRIAGQELDHSDMLNIDLVLSDLPIFLPRFLAGRIELNQIKRHSKRRGLLRFGEVCQVHLSCTDEQVNDLIRAANTGELIEVEGDEIALCINNTSWLCWTHQALDWLGLDHDHVLRAEPDRLARAGLRACHSIWVERVKIGDEEKAEGSNANAHFTQASAAATVFGKDMVSKVMQSHKQPQHRPNARQAQQTENQEAPNEHKK